MNTGNPFPLEKVADYPCNDPIWVEKTFHDEFKEKLVRGEWYHLEEEELEVIESEMSEYAETGLLFGRTAPEKQKKMPDDDYRGILLNERIEHHGVS